MRKPKFKPVVTRVKLNPEQAVLTCDCYSTGNQLDHTGWQAEVVTVGICEGAKYLVAVERRLCMGDFDHFDDWIGNNPAPDSVGS